MGHGGSLPRHWIGVEKGWQEHSDRPWEHLVSLPPADMRTHTLLIGGTGGGKTNLVHHLIAQDVLVGHSFCVLDLRGDLALATIDICAGRVSPRLVRLLDLRDKERPLGFNPLYGAGEPYFRALHLLDVIASESESWGPQLSETLRNCAMLLAEARAPLTEVERLFYDSDYRFQCLARVESESVVAFWARFNDLSRDRQAALSMPVLNKVSLLFATSTLRKVLRHPKPLDLGSHLNARGSILLVSLAVDELHGAAKMMGRLVLASLCREVFSRVDIPESRRNPVRLYVDEFEHFGLSEFETILAEGRRFGLSLVLAHQTLAQLDPKMRSMILNNVGTKFVFRCGREDGATLSKDLTGDPRAYDFAELPVGEAVMWRKGLGCLEVEINEPLLRDVGRLSPLGSQFLLAVRNQVPLFSEPPRKVDRPAAATLRKPGARRSPASEPVHVAVESAAMEDWL